MPPLTESEKDELQRAVSMLGRDWRAVAAAGVCGGRDADTLRKAWDALSVQGIRVASEVVANPVADPLLAGSTPERLDLALSGPLDGFGWVFQLPKQISYVNRIPKIC